MLKLKILNKPKMLKLKCTSKFPDVVLANFQKKEVIPTEEIQEVVADKPYDGLSKVTVQPYTLEEKVVTPSKETQEVLPSNSNGLSKVVVKGDENLTADNIRQGASIFGVEGTVLGAWDTSQIMQCNNMFRDNKTMVEAPYFNTENVTNMTYMFYRCTKLEKIPVYNTSKVTTLSYFAYESKIKEFPALDLSSVTDITSICDRCSNLQKVPLLDVSEAKYVTTYAFNKCTQLVDFGGLKNLGKAYTQKSNNYSQYTFSMSTCTALTHDSLINIINNLYDLNLTYDVANGGTLYTQKLVLGATNIAKLSSDELAICAQKGWTVS